MMLVFLTPTSAHRGQQQYCYKVKEQSNIWHGFYLAGREAAGVSEEGESGISNTEWRMRPVCADRVRCQSLSSSLLLAVVSREESSSKPAAICRGGLIWFVELANLRKSELWAVLRKPLQVKKEAVVIDAKNLLSWGEKCLRISM